MELRYGIMEPIQTRRFSILIFHNIILSNQHLQDLNPLVAGEEACRPGHSFGPAVRRYTLIHYVLSGQGTLYTHDGSYPVFPGQAFLIFPDEITTYTADGVNPWHYQWIGFDGSLSERFRELPRVFPASGDFFSRMICSARTTEMPEFHVAGDLLLFYAELFTHKSSQNKYVRQVESFLQAAYMDKISIQQLSEQLGLDRRYLTRLFHAHTGKSIQDYLIEIRLREACKHLSSDHSVRDTAILCGYEDVTNFSKAFKKHYGISPAKWKLQNK